MSGGGMVEFRLPDVGEGLEEAEIVAWLVAEGATVARDQPLVEILTDKAQVELPAPVAGRVVRLAVPEGERVKVGTVLVELAVNESGLSATPAAVTSAPAAAAPPTSPQPSSSPVVDLADAPVESTSIRRPGQRPKASPSTRRLAATSGVDLAAVVGSGPGGRILASDVLTAASPQPLSAPPTPAPAEPPPSLPGAASVAAGASSASLQPIPFGVQPLRGIRRLTAEAMARSWAEIPHITGMDEVDASALLDARARLRARLGDRGATLTPLALLALAVVRALRRFPLVNASIDLGAATLTVHEQVNLGIAVATDAGLVVPIVTNADQRGLLGLADEIARLAAAARSRTVTPTELRGGTFTITNYGALGGRFATPIIRPGEVGIIGFGAIRPRPVVIPDAAGGGTAGGGTTGGGAAGRDGAGGGTVVARPTLPVVFSADHRLIDGDLATAFQEDVIATVREPLTLLVDG